MSDKDGNIGKGHEKKKHEKSSEWLAKAENGGKVMELPKEMATNSSLEIEQRNMMRLTTN